MLLRSYLVSKLISTKVNSFVWEKLSLGTEYIQLFGCKEGAFPFKYLEIPMHHQRISNKEQSPIEEKFQKKLSTWKGKLLFMLSSAHKLRTI